LSLSFDSQLILQSSADNIVRLFDACRERQLHSLQSHSAKVYATGFLSPSKAYTASMDRTIKCWDLQLGATIHSYPAVSAITGGCSNPDQSGSIVTSHQNGSLSLWSSLQDGSVHNWKLHNASVTGVSFSSDAKLLASQSVSNEVVITSMDNLALRWSTTPRFEEWRVTE